MSSDWDLIETIYALSSPLINMQITCHHRMTDEDLLDLEEQLCGEIQTQGIYINTHIHQRGVYPNGQVPVLLRQNK
jgi:hypothetical protein